MSPDHPSPARDGSLTLPADVGSPAAARRFAAGLLDDLDRSVRYDVSIAVSELVTNSVRHGRPPVTVRVGRTGTEVSVSVHDSGGGVLPTDPDATPHAAPGGRGLLIVAALGSDWGVDVDPDGTGKTVWVTFPTTAGDLAPVR